MVKKRVTRERWWYYYYDDNRYFGGSYDSCMSHTRKRNDDGWDGMGWDEMDDLFQCTVWYICYVDIYIIFNKYRTLIYAAIVIVMLSLSLEYNSSSLTENRTIRWIYTIHPRLPSSRCCCYYYGCSFVRRKRRRRGRGNKQREWQQNKEGIESVGKRVVPDNTYAVTKYCIQPLNWQLIISIPVVVYDCYYDSW